MLQFFERIKGRIDSIKILSNLKKQLKKDEQDTIKKLTKEKLQKILQPYMVEKKSEL